MSSFHILSKFRYCNCLMGEINGPNICLFSKWWLHEMSQWCCLPHGIGSKSWMWSNQPPFLFFHFPLLLSHGFVWATMEIYITKTDPSFLYPASTWWPRKCFRRCKDSQQTLWTSGSGPQLNIGWLTEHVKWHDQRRINLKYHSWKSTTLTLSFEIHQIDLIHWKNKHFFLFSLRWLNL